MFVTLFYTLPLNLTAIAILLVCYSVNVKIRQEIKNYKPLPIEDIGEYVMAFIKIVLMCICPIINIIVCFYCILHWEDFRDETLKSAKKNYYRRLYELERKNHE